MKEEMEGQPASMNAFELISLNRGLNLENLFETDKVYDHIYCTIVSHECLQYLYFYGNFFWSLEDMANFF